MTVEQLIAILKDKDPKAVVLRHDADGVCRVYSVRDAEESDCAWAECWSCPAVTIN